MEIARRDRGKEIPCSHCGAVVSVPASFDFLSSELRAAVDEDTAAGLFLMVAVGTACFCMPLTAYAWWSATGTIESARRDDRDVPRLILVLRAFAAVCCLAQLGFYSVVLAHEFLR